MTSTTSTMSTTSLIAICGEKRSGKDVLAQHLVDNHGYTKISFADPLKKVVKTLFNFTDIQVGIDEKNCIGHEKDTVDDKWGISPRQALQFFGTEVLQYKIQELLPGIKRDFFAESLISRINLENNSDNSDNNKKYVISDMRFLHEYEKLKEHSHRFDILTIRVMRPGNSENTGNTYSHISETEYLNIPYDFEIINNSTIEKYIETFEIYYNHNK
jgi:hypothetical protein